MSSPVVQLEGIGKSYRIAHQSDAAYSYERLGDRVMQWAKRPFSSRQADTSETFWALKDISFELHEGEVLGIVGSNGAGKSTLLKLISRITRPTRGRLTIDGQVASLLEVGTGFHPELTGRENIYLNGAVLGMTRSQIHARFDEIVSFAGVETFLDTPVKRYSSGMYVRLAFAVAAHLDPEILIIDEVLAVGDAAFRKRCLERMGEIASNSGRTILFVSHNMAAVRSLCTRALLLENGTLTSEGSPEEIISQYHSKVLQGNEGHTHRHDEKDIRSGVGLKQVQILDLEGQPTAMLLSGAPFTLRFTLHLQSPQIGLRAGFRVETAEGTIVFGMQAVEEEGSQAIPTPPGTYQIDCRIGDIRLNSGQYFVTIGIELPPYRGALFLVNRCLHFTIDDTHHETPGFRRPPGLVLPTLRWSKFQAIEAP